jgi:hypothetical protein
MGWHRGLVIKRGGCQLTTPYVLWDTRTWDGTTGLGTGGLPNLGAGGSDFDLDVSVISTNAGTRTAVYASQNGAAWASVPGTLDWANIGGLPCAAPWTYITAYGAFPNTFDYCEADVLFSTTAGSGGQFAGGQTIGFYKSAPPVNAADGSTFNNIFVGSYYSLWNAPQTEVANNADTYLKNIMTTTTLNTMGNGGSYAAYRDFAQITNTVAGTQDEGDGFAVADGCSDFDPSSTLTDDYKFFYLGEHRATGYPNPPTVGDAWSGVIGAALFRGCPSEADLAYWHNYFYA